MSAYLTAQSIDTQQLKQEADKQGVSMADVARWLIVRRPQPHAT